MTELKAKRRVVLIGAGFAGSTHWIPGIAKSAPFELVAIVDPEEGARLRAAENAPGVQVFATANEVPPEVVASAIAFITTPDHYRVIVDLAKLGFRDMIVEKPIVSRVREVFDLQRLLSTLRQCRVYSIDHYFLRFLALEYALGRLSFNDPRVPWLRLHEGSGHRLEEIPGCLGKIEGVSYTNIEAGALGIPFLDTHPWMEHDTEIGGMLRDLGPHALAPLFRVGLLRWPAVVIHDVGLARFTATRDSFQPVRRPSDIEMYVRALMVSDDVTVNVTFGKAPFPGKERSLAVRGENGEFFAGLARGQSSVVTTKDGKTSRFSLQRSENDFVLEEAMLFFADALPGFDGNVAASCAVLQLNEEIRQHYWQHLNS